MLPNYYIPYTDYCYIEAPGIKGFCPFCDLLHIFHKVKASASSASAKTAERKGKKNHISYTHRVKSHAKQYLWPQYSDTELEIKQQNSFCEDCLVFMLKMDCHVS